MNKKESKNEKPSVLSSELKSRISNYHQRKLLKTTEDLPDAFRIYTMWASSLTRFYFYKAIDHQNILPDNPDDFTLYNADFVAKMITQIPVLDEDIKTLNTAMDEAKQLIAQLWRNEVNIAKLFITNFDIYRTMEQLAPIFRIPETGKWDDSETRLKSMLAMLQNSNQTEANITKTYKTVGVHSPLVAQTQVIRFQNAAIINGRLYYEDTQEFQNTPPHAFKIQSNLTIPRNIDRTTQEIISNYTKTNPQAHDTTRKYRERPFLEVELAWAVYTTFAKHRIGSLNSVFGGFFMYEDNDGTGGGRGKSLITDSIKRIANSGVEANSMLSYAQSYQAEEIAIPQVQIIAAKNILTLLTERGANSYSDAEISFIKSMREESKAAVGKYQTQAQNTTFKGNVFTSSNYIPKFKEHSDAIRDRFYGIEFTLKFAQRQNPEVMSHIYSDDFLGSLICWAFSEKFDFANPATQYKMEQHFKEVYDNLSRKNNNILNNIHEVLEMRHDPRHTENFIEEEGVLSIKQSYFKYQFAFNAGSVEGSSRHGIGKTTGEAQYKSWTAFVEYLQANLDGEAQRAINFYMNKRVGKTRERFITIDTTTLPPADNGGDTTHIEEEWLIANGYLEEKRDDIIDIDDIFPPEDADTTDTTETETPEIVFPPEADFDLDSDPKEAFDDNAQHIATPENIHIITENYQRDASQLVDMFADPIEDPQSNPREYADLIHDLCVITKRYSELTDQVPLYINITNIKFPHLKFKCGECIFEATPITPSKVRLSFRKNLE